MDNHVSGRTNESAIDDGNPTLISLRDINKTYQSNGAKIEVLNDLSVDIGRGETIAVVGESGIGKSTFLHILGTLDPPDSGSFFYEGTDIFTFDRNRLADFRNRTIGFVFQFHYLLAEFSALENVMMPGLIRRISRAQMAEMAEAMLVRVNLKDRIRHRVSDLSGGEQQRVALARALVLKPEILLADEPTGNLDKKNSARMHEMLMELNQEYKMTIVTVTHNMNLADYMNKRMTLVDGKLVGI